MRLNKFIASTSSLSRRGADEAIKLGRVTINGVQASLASDVKPVDTVKLDGQVLKQNDSKTILMLNKPVGYVCSRKGQGSQTIYDLLPAKYHHLNPVGRLDKDSSGLLLLTDDGELANQLTHPSFQKQKVYEVTLDKQLTETDLSELRQGIELQDGPSRLEVRVARLEKGPVTTSHLQPITYLVLMHEGRNRQIRRTFEYLDLKVERLHRIKFGNYTLDQSVESGKYITK